MDQQSIGFNGISWSKKVFAIAIPLVLGGCGISSNNYLKPEQPLVPSNIPSGNQASVIYGNNAHRMVNPGGPMIPYPNPDIKRQFFVLPHNNAAPENGDSWKVYLRAIKHRNMKRALSCIKISSQNSNPSPAGSSQWAYIDGKYQRVLTHKTSSDRGGYNNKDFCWSTLRYHIRQQEKELRYLSAPSAALSYLKLQNALAGQCEEKGASYCLNSSLAHKAQALGSSLP